MRCRHRGSKLKLHPKVAGDSGPKEGASLDGLGTGGQLGRHIRLSVQHAIHPGTDGLLVADPAGMCYAACVDHPAVPVSQAAMRSATMMVGRFVFAAGTVGMIYASATTKFVIPGTRPRASTTAPSAGSAPMAQVPTGSW